MRIMRFNEQVEKMDSETAVEIIKELEKLLALVDEKFKTTKEVINTIEKYVDKSKQIKDKLDEALVSLREVDRSMDESVKDKLGNAISALKKYTEDGSEYVLGETNVE
jgi:ABC-type transporter Mla subunit MlaD